ncbi:MAG: aldehyde ferredoxin oxidoreductase family protein [Desulfohalobiaceae bacterium]|nr:aldehyde ferredoxin oxidoreductase family protein [Desulfohalobiaceae bacterium]
MLYGYAGQILRVDLDGFTVEKQPLPEDLVDKYIGGRGFVARLLYDLIPPGTDPYSSENIVVIAAGPLSGHYLPGSGKTHFGTKSPATGMYGDGNLGGHFGPALKYAGYDVLILSGKASGPSYLLIEDDTVELRDASAYWGLGSITVEEAMKQDLGQAYEICTIGPAGENLSRFACISHDFGRQCGRTGIGTVLGDKKIKAIAVKGTGGLPVYDLDGLYQAGKRAYRDIYAKPGFTGWQPEGTAGITNFVNQVGAFPTRNFQTSSAEHYQQINGRQILEKIRITDKGCFCCPIPCGKYSRAGTALGTVNVEGPEFETISMFGGNCDLQTIEDVAYANYICDELGLDTISAGAVVGFALECHEKGLLSDEDFGRRVAFGDLPSVVHILELIAGREKIGDALADGVRLAAEKIGQGSERFAMHVKGLEWTGYECRNAPGMMLAYLTADVGAHHNRAWVLGQDVTGTDADVHSLIQAGGSGERLPKSDVRGKAAGVIASQHLRPAFDVLGTCRLQMMELGFEVEHYEELLALVTGRRKTWGNILEVSERIWHLTRAFSVREIEGFGRHMDYPPPRLCHDPVQSGPNQGHCISEREIDILLDEYYQARGWDENGLPTRETLDRVGLSDVG